MSDSEIRHHAEFWFETPHAARIYEVLAPEACDETGERSHAMISCNGDRLSLSVTAGDIPAMRAALNMWLRLITIAEEMQEIRI
ncbi:KEOPS complex subunit Pcc1 [Methanocalculus chunghsingensis]|uniref:KEOPS complex subunit Pcc1 n=1 Tax=Methanocalculus chunghsingensis TaxID=156457 RepID=UPI0031BB1F95